MSLNSYHLARQPCHIPGIPYTWGFIARLPYDPALLAGALGLRDTASLSDAIDDARQTLVLWKLARAEGTIGQVSTFDLLELVTNDAIWDVCQLTSPRSPTPDRDCGRWSRYRNEALTLWYIRRIATNPAGKLYGGKGNNVEAIHVLRVWCVMLHDEVRCCIRSDGMWRRAVGPSIPAIVPCSSPPVAIQGQQMPGQTGALGMHRHHMAWVADRDTLREQLDIWQRRERDRFKWEIESWDFEISHSSCFPTDQRWGMQPITQMAGGGLAQHAGATTQTQGIEDIDRRNRTSAASPHRRLSQDTQPSSPAELASSGSQTARWYPVQGDFGLPPEFLARLQLNDEEIESSLGADSKALDYDYGLTEGNPPDGTGTSELGLPYQVNILPALSNDRDHTQSQAEFNQPAYSTYLPNQLGSSVDPNHGPSGNMTPTVTAPGIQVAATSGPLPFLNQSWSPPIDGITTG